MAFQALHWGVQWTYLPQIFLILFEPACFWPPQLLLTVCSGKKENKANLLSVCCKNACPKISMDIPHFTSSKKQFLHHLLLSIQSLTGCCCHPLHRLFPRMKTATVGLLVWKRFVALITLFCPPQTRTSLIAWILTHIISLFSYTKMLSFSLFIPFLIIHIILVAFF